MYHKHIHLLGLLLEATQSGKAVWRRESPNTHHAALSGFPCWLRFRRVPTAGEDGSGADAVDVLVGEETLTFYCGSEGYDLVQQILVAAYPEAFQQARTTAIRMDAMLNRMESAAR
jgi:hypothetical protein